MTFVFLLRLLLEDPDLVPAVGQFEGAVVPGGVERLVDVLHPVSLQAFQEFQELLALRFLIGESAVPPVEEKTKKEQMKFFCSGICSQLETFGEKKKKSRSANTKVLLTLHNITFYQQLDL